MRLGVAMETKQSSLRGAERRKVKCERVLRCTVGNIRGSGEVGRSRVPALAALCGWYRAGRGVSSQLTVTQPGAQRTKRGAQTRQSPCSPSLLLLHIRISTFPWLPLRKVNNKRVTRLNHKALADNSPFKQLH